MNNGDAGDTHQPPRRPAPGPGSPVPMALDIAERAAQDVERATSALDAAQERLRAAVIIERFSRELHGHLEGGRPSEALRLLRGGSKALDLLRKRSPESADAVDAIGHELVTRVQDAFGALLRAFPSAIAEAGLVLDPGSRHPKYSLGDGFITVQFDKRRQEAIIQPRDGRRVALGIDLPVLVRHLRVEFDRLFQRTFEASVLLDVVARAYAVVDAKHDQAGQPIRLKELIHELAKDRNFRADEFNVDLSRLVRSETESARVVLANCRDEGDGVLLWQLDQRGYYGYIRVKVPS